MSGRHLTILEVSQKQAYIFQSNELKKNVLNSSVIAWIMDVGYLEQTAGDEKLFNQKENLVYSGGGHTVLEFPSQDQAACFTKKITKAVRKEYPGIEVFAKTVPYKEEKSPAENLKELRKKLERKKSERRAAFHQGSFGVEKTDANTRKPILEHTENKMPEKEKKTEESLMPKGYHGVLKFEDLGGSKDRSNFIAVVHIDGNSMGKRVENLQHRLSGLEWAEYKKKLKEFSESIDEDFKSAYKGMSEYVAGCMEKGLLKELNLTAGNFPVRRIITAGDDICFVAEGRIGLECAAAFIKQLGGRQNRVDHEGYAACAGVAIVHQKYPFYKAYELAEKLCGSAKKYGAGLSSDGFGNDVSAIDWHIEFGEVKDTLEEIRADYLDTDGNSITGRPYIVRAGSAASEAGSSRKYYKLRELIQKLRQEDGYARGTIKELRSAMKNGKEETEHFIQFHKIGEIKWDLNDSHKALFDAIELIDTFIAL